MIFARCLDSEEMDTQTMRAAHLTVQSTGHCWFGSQKETWSYGFVGDHLLTRFVRGMQHDDPPSVFFQWMRCIVL